GACGSFARVLIAGSTPCMPATKMKSPARTPRLHVPSFLIAPGGERVRTPLGEIDCARQGADARTKSARPARTDRCSIPQLSGRSGDVLGIRCSNPKEPNGATIADLQGMLAKPAHADRPARPAVGAVPHRRPAAEPHEPQ